MLCDDDGDDSAGIGIKKVCCVKIWENIIKVKWAK